MDEVDYLLKRIPSHLREEAKQTWFSIGRVGDYTYIKIKPEKMIHLQNPRGSVPMSYAKVSMHPREQVEQVQKQVFKFDDDF